MLIRYILILLLTHFSWFWRISRVFRDSFAGKREEKQARQAAKEAAAAAAAAAANAETAN